MTPARNASPLRRRIRPVLTATLLVAALALSGCGGDAKAAKPTPTPSVAAPTGNVQVPDGVTLTKPGEELKFGQSATVAYSANPRRGSVLQLTVLSAQQGRISDLAAYQLGSTYKTARPYYVRATVKNVGTGDLSRFPVPLYVVDNTDSLVLPTSFNNTFAKCPSPALPAGFTQGKSVTSCWVYLVQNGGTMTAVSYRPQQAYSGITWTGTIAPPPAPAKKTQKHKKKAQN